MYSTCLRWFRAGRAFWPYRRLLKAGEMPIESAREAAESRCAAVFVPGWGSNAGVGVPLMEELCRALGDCAGYLAPLQSKPLPHAEKVDAVKKILHRSLAETDGPILVVAHSYGGLLSCRALLELEADTSRVFLVTLNSPFRGPRRGLVQMGRMLGWFLRGSGEDPELAFMRTDSTELARLRRDLESRSFELRTVMSKEDEFLTFESGNIEGSTLEVPGLLGHTGLLVRPKERAALIDSLTREFAATSQARAES